MKLRITETKSPKGKLKFKIQEKFLWFWLDLPGTKSYKRLEKAQKIVNDLNPISNIPIKKLGS